METWNKIPGCPEFIEASSEGRIRRLEWEGKIMGRWEKVLIRKVFPAKILVCRKPSQKGYLRHRVDNKTFFAHRLVAYAFLDNPDNLPQINHKNGNKTDNRPENLEWVTNAQNRAHAVSLGLIAKGDRIGNAKLTYEKVRSIRNLLGYGVSQKDIAKLHGVCQQTIGKIHTGKSWNK